MLELVERAQLRVVLHVEATKRIETTPRSRAITTSRVRLLRRRDGAGGAPASWVVVTGSSRRAAVELPGDPDLERVDAPLDRLRLFGRQPSAAVVALTSHCA